ncbi:SGNH/GDSL hydrolase family protein [Sulfitobacter sp. S190]|uniref:SGNH/GDSL hydrolase family protein n=1 Tax=Sulfitobacter sp. S190 TaxID=2867022 RepID=UPI0021A464FC|nr:SGNH/GDSL hydrolase family protein [Sulfitobacter sp. S190]UWR23195.1 SGNH/GDSL hydrolase family protein [Sulfitobacter sp. S190]
MVAAAKHLRRMIGHTLMTLALSPVLAVQALGLRRRALRLSEADGPRQGRVGGGQPLRLLIVGDSSAAGVGVATQDAALAGALTRGLAGRGFAVAWALLAACGATTASTRKSLVPATLAPADAVVIVLGVNDVTHFAPLRRWLRDHRALRHSLRQRTGARHIFVSQMPPLGQFPLLPDPLRWVLGQRALLLERHLIADLHAEPDSHYTDLPLTLSPADMAKDGFHPGAGIYAAWGDDLAATISDRIGHAKTPPAQG